MTRPFNVRIRLAHSVRALRSLPRNPNALSLATLVIVVFALGVLQYRWIDEVSRAQESQATSRLREEVRLIVDALDTEITRAVLVFTILPTRDGKMDDALERAWATWKQGAPWPRVLSGVWFLESTDSGWHTRSWGDAGAFDPRSVPRVDIRVDPAGSGSSGDGGVIGHAEARRLALFVDGQPAMLSPVPAMGPFRMNWVLIRFDLSYVTDTLFSQLLERYSTAEDRSEFRFQIGPRGSAAPGTVITAAQFHFRPDCLMPPSDEQPALHVGAVTLKPGGGPQTARHVSGYVGVGPTASMPSFFHADARCHVPPSPSDAGLLQLSVLHAPGSVSDVFTGFRRRNLFVSGVVLVVLLAALTALVVSTERARRLARLQTVVAAGISHELRTPLASLNVAADHLKNGHVENIEQARRYGEIIEAQSRRLRHVVDQALALTGPSQPNGVFSRHPVLVPEIINAATEGLAPALGEAAIEIERHTAPDVPMIFADPDVILRCLTNLIENSIKYAASGGWIQVSARAGRHSGRPVVEVTVEDRGPGIEDDDRSAVFEPFYRGSSARQSRQPGSGLGLAIVKSAVEAHGGWIKLERAVPQGCRFHLFLPAANHDGAAHSTESKV